MERLDVRGLSCPMPAMQVRKMIKKVGTGSIEVLVDVGAGRDNIVRIAGEQGWKVDEEPGDEYSTLTLKK